MYGVKCHDRWRQNRKYGRRSRMPALHNGYSPAALVAAADGALYRAKREGRNRVAQATA